MAPRPLITCTTANEHCMEGTVCHCYDSAHMGQLIAAAKILFHCDNQTVVNIWEKGSTKSLDIMVLVRLLYFCAARYHIYICVQHIPGNNSNIADGTYMSLLGRPLQETCSGSCNNTRHHLCMANPSFHNCLMQLRYVSWCSESTSRTYQSGLIAYTSFCFHFNINHLPATSLTLQYFCADKSQSISYQTLKVYLAAIRLMHIEHELPDPTMDQTLLLVCRGIRRHQKEEDYQSQQIF